MAQGPVVNSPADMSRSNDPSNQGVTQTVVPSPDTPTYTGSDIDKTKKQPPASDRTSPSTADGQAGMPGSPSPPNGP